jgi:hypothetical protein
VLNTLTTAAMIRLGKVYGNSWWTCVERQTADWMSGSRWRRPASTRGLPVMTADGW